ncbi:hypothetical protein E2C01_056854 [Portunus trituberculatus]|uniref:Uncharacterized protein n=1 Tax=Portunus trituberculatus TaxID=210409 RepID=A0A5B7H1R6_PORTR|nr:hypothetical protein [Portunus trituberculatus]
MAFSGDFWGSSVRVTRLLRYNQGKHSRKPDSGEKSKQSDFIQQTSPYHFQGPFSSPGPRDSPSLNGPSPELRSLTGSSQMIESIIASRTDKLLSYSTVVALD